MLWREPCIAPRVSVHTYKVGQRRQQTRVACKPTRREYMSGDTWCSSPIRNVVQRVGKDRGKRDGCVFFSFGGLGLRWIGVEWSRPKRSGRGKGVYVMLWDVSVSYLIYMFLFITIFMFIFSL